MLRFAQIAVSAALLLCIPSWSVSSGPSPSRLSGATFSLVRDSDSGKGQAAGRRFVQSEADLRIHFEAHIGRVKLLGIALFERNRERYEGAGINVQMVKDFLAVHDQAKLDDTPLFRAKFHDLATSPDDLKPILTRLWEVYATSDLKRIKPVVDYLNRADDRVAAEFFSKLKIPEPHKSIVVALLKEIERVADRVDRNLDPVAGEEFGRAVGEEAPSIARYLAGEELVLAQSLIRDYRVLTLTQSFQVVKTRRCYGRVFQFPNRIIIQ